MNVPYGVDREDYIRNVRSSMEEPMAAFLALWGEPYRMYKSARTIISQIYSLGVTGELENEFNEMLNEKNVKLIDETNLLLKQIISGSDVPFVYEKTGVRYENFLLDEFQDTSWVQWDNFYPLLKESEDNGQENFIVGDVKQSIYRFRDSDWQLLASEVGNKFQNSEATSLDTNYRSLSQIVNFNNEFFIEIAQRLDNQLKSENVKFEALYKGVAQNVSPKSAESADKGCVRLTFCPSNRTRVPDGEERVTQVDVLIKAIKEVIDSGKGQYSDIAILVRGIAEGLKVTNALIENNIPIITTDALEVKKSVLVGKLISLLYKVDEPENKIGGYWADQIGLEVPSDYSSLVDLCEELIRKLNEFYGSEYDGEVAYIQAFMDFVSTWAKDNDNDLHAFLKAWEEASVKICSPDGGDAIRLMTIHGSKGLDFPYVILPFAEKIELFKDNSERWCVPNQDYTDIPKAISQNIYNVKLSSKASPDSIFDDSFRIEYEKQVVDNFNILYVALTRASRAMYIIGEKPSMDNGAPETWPNFSNFSAALFYYMWNKYRTNANVHIDDDNYRLGELPSFPHEQKEDAPQALECHYFSHPINDERGERLLLDRDDSEYFSEGSSARLEGIRLHKVMELVRLPEGLKGAVYQILARGDFSIEEANNAYKQLSKAIAKVHEQYGWFSKESIILNETSIITSEDEQGKVYRPDRVEIHPDGSVVIIDYKFGRPNSSRHEAYLDQIRNYADLYRSMGHENVRAYLWYVAHNRVVEGK